jgi:hypothetical protein
VLALSIVLAFFIIGFIAGRKTFISELGDSPRRIKPTYGTPRMTSDYQRALEWSLFVFFFWFVLIPIRGMIRETPSEQADRKRQELEELRAEMKVLEKEYGLKGDLRGGLNGSCK